MVSLTRMYQSCRIPEPLVNTSSTMRVNLRIDLPLARQMAHIRTVRIRDKGQNFAQHALVKPRRLSTYNVENPTSVKTAYKPTHTVRLPVAKQKKNTILQATTVYH